MKKLIITLVIITVSFLSNSQQQLFTYTFSVSTITNTESSKEVLSAIGNEFEMRNRRITGNYQFSMQSTVNTKEQDFAQLLATLGYQLTSFTKDSGQNYLYSTKTSPGGTNCSSASIVCSNDSFNGTATDYGTQELNPSNRGCLADNENQSSWYYINVGVGGSLTMLIDPVNNSDDYDFAVWGPFTSANAAANCPPTSSPIRCSWSSRDDLTGFVSSGWGITSYTCGPWWWPFNPCYGWITPTDNSENDAGDSYVSALNVAPGEIYILVVDNYSNSGDPYGITWGGTAVLDCTPIVLPVELSNFEGVKNEGFNHLEWTTTSESGNDYFLMERSIDNENWTVIDHQSGAGYSNSELNYYFDDYSFRNSINYYRLSQVDYNGKVNKYKVVAIDNQLTDVHVVEITNMMGQKVNDDFSGPRIIRYSDGSILRKVGN